MKSILLLGGDQLGLGFFSTLQYNASMDVLSFSKKTKMEADELLSAGNVKKVLDKYGEVEINGSYKYDLMYGPDIDLVVLTENPDEAAENVLIDFVKERNFQKYQFGDFNKFPRKNRPRSYIVVLIQEHEGRRWEIEIWFAKQKPQGDIDEELDNLLMNATEEQKKTILQLKHQRETLSKTKNQLGSPTIYKGVLQEDKFNIEDY